MQFKCLLLFYQLQLQMEKRQCENWKKALQIYDFHVQKPLTSLLVFNIFLFLKSVPILPMEILNSLQSSWEIQGWTWEGAELISARAFYGF